MTHQFSFSTGSEGRFERERGESLGKLESAFSQWLLERSSNGRSHRPIAPEPISIDQWPLIRFLMKFLMRFLVRAE